MFEKRALLVDKVAEAKIQEDSFDSRLKALQEDIVAFDLELKVVNTTTQLWMDSTLIHGMPQRYQTKYLRTQVGRHIAQVCSFAAVATKGPTTDLCMHVCFLISPYIA